VTFKNTEMALSRGHCSHFQLKLNVGYLEGYLLTVHPLKPYLASVFKDRWRIMAEGRNRGGLPLMHDYGDFAVLMVA
jgi:hypothetical protein